MKGLVLATVVLLSGAMGWADEAVGMNEVWKAYCSEDFARVTALLDEAATAQGADAFEIAYLRARVAGAAFKKYFHENELAGRTLKPMK
jgi:hypothetical protein